MMHAPRVLPPVPAARCRHAHHAAGAREPGLAAAYPCAHPPTGGVSSQCHSATFARDSCPVVMPGSRPVCSGQVPGRGAVSPQGRSAWLDSQSGCGAGQAAPRGMRGRLLSAPSWGSWLLLCCASCCCRLSRSRCWHALLWTPTVTARWAAPAPQQQCQRRSAGAGGDAQGRAASCPPGLPMAPPAWPSRPAQLGPCCCLR